MNDEPARPFCVSTPRCALAERLAHRPELLARRHPLLDTLDQAVAAGADAPAAADRVMEERRPRGREVLGHWARETHDPFQTQVRRQHPPAIPHGKKKLLQGQTTFGWITVQAGPWRLGRRGQVGRPFCARAGVEPRGPARRRQCVLVDFGAEESFTRATQRGCEHYGVAVAWGRRRRHTRAHGAQLSGRAVPPPQAAAARLVTPMDGSLIPIVTPPAQGADRRKGKPQPWREARRGLAREKESATACSGATLGSGSVAGERWRQTACAAGLGVGPRGPGVGAGAEWIPTPFGEPFATPGRSRLDFWHISAYLGAAAVVIQPRKAQAWRRRQQGRLLDNNVRGVLRALAPPWEAPSQHEAPVRAAQRDLERPAGATGLRRRARAARRPIGSGAIESGHRQVIQQRLKLAGCWGGKEPNAEAMLGRRAARAHQLGVEAARGYQSRCLAQPSATVLHPSGMIY